MGRLGLSGLLSLLIIGALHAWLPPSVPPDSSAIPVVQRLVPDTDSAGVVPDDAGLEVALPESDAGPSAFHSDVVWYRMHLVPVHDGRRVGVLVRSSSARVELWVDGVPYADEEWSGRSQRRIHGPALLTAPRRALERAGYEALLRLEADGSPPRLLTVRHGNASGMEDWQRRERDTVGFFLRVITTGLWVFGIAALLVAAQDRSRSEYAWFGTTLILWSLHCTWLLIRNAPLPTETWLALGDALLLGFGVSALVFLRRLSGRAGSVHESLILAVSLVLCLGMVLSASLGVSAFINALRWLLFPALLLAGASLFQLVYGRASRAVKPEPIDAEIDLGRFAIPTTITFFIGVHDALLGLGLLDAPRSLLQFSAPLVLTAFAGLLLRRYLLALGRVETFNVDLRRRIEQREAEISAEFQQRAAVEAAIAAREERMLLVATACSALRSRIADARAQVAEGAPLVEVGRRVSAALEQMRLIIDALDVAEGGFAAAFGNLRSRLRRRLEAADIDLDWELDDSVKGPTSVDDVYRVLRLTSAGIGWLLEAFVTRRITIEAGNDDGGGRLWLELCADPLDPSSGLDTREQSCPDWNDALAELDACVQPLERGYRVTFANRTGTGTGPPSRPAVTAT